MQQRFYFDTSVFGGLFDTEFEKETTILFEKVALGQIKCVYSNLTENELANAPERVRKFFENLGDEFKEKVTITAEALALALVWTGMASCGERNVFSMLAATNLRTMISLS